jgi:hypothetical protein
MIGKRDMLVRSECLRRRCIAKEAKFFDTEAQNLLGCTDVFLIECLPTLHRYVLPPSSRL